MESESNRDATTRTPEAGGLWAMEMHFLDSGGWEVQGASRLRPASPLPHTQKGQGGPLGSLSWRERPYSHVRASLQDLRTPAHWGSWGQHTTLRGGTDFQCRVGRHGVHGSKTAATQGSTHLVDPVHDGILDVVGQVCGLEEGWVLLRAGGHLLHADHLHGVSHHEGVDHGQVSALETDRERPLESLWETAAFERQLLLYC